MYTDQMLLFNKFRSLWPLALILAVLIEVLIVGSIPYLDIHFSVPVLSHLTVVGMLLILLGVLPYYIYYIFTVGSLYKFPMRKQSLALIPFIVMLFGRALVLSTGFTKAEVRIELVETPSESYIAVKDFSARFQSERIGNVSNNSSCLRVRKGVFGVVALELKNCSVE